MEKDDSTISKNLRLDVLAFRKGERNFTPEKLSAIKIYLLKVKEILNSLSFFRGKIKDRVIVGCMGDGYYHDIFESIFKSQGAEIAFIVNLKSKKVVFSKKGGLDFDLCAFAKIISEGSCIDDSSGLAIGNINETFLKFTKTLTQC